VIVHDLDIFSAASGPSKADTELVVEANAMLSAAIAPKRLQAIAGRHSKIIQAISLIQLFQLSPGHCFDADEPTNPISIEEGFGVSAPECLDHVE
jgi:hypothetical protein